jgi:hypothetical protein
MTGFPSISLTSSGQGKYIACRLTPRERCKSLAENGFPAARGRFFRSGGAIFPVFRARQGKRHGGTADRGF